MAAGTTSGMTHRKTAASSAKTPSAAIGWAAGVPRRGRRYHLYVSLACPWAHRTLIVRKLKGLESLVDVSVVSWLMRENGWTFDPAHGSTGDRLDGLAFLHQRYTRDDPHYSGRVTVPLLWDKQAQKIVNNESADIVRIFNSAFDAIGANALDFYPEPLREEIERLNGRIYPAVNNGVYRAGFATRQDAYEEAFVQLFEELDYLEGLLGERRYLAGEYLTEADIRLFTTLVRFDAVYHGHFKCNLRRIEDYPNLSGWLRELYQRPGIGETVDFEHIKGHYYASHRTINPTGIVPLGPRLDWRARQAGNDFPARASGEKAEGSGVLAGAFEPGQLVAQLHDFADDHQGRRMHFVLSHQLRQVFQGSGEYPLLGGGPLLDQRRRGLCGATVGDQLLADHRQSHQAHVEHQGLLAARQAGPVEVEAAVVLQVAGDEGAGLGEVAVGQRDAGVGTATGGGGDAGDHLAVAPASSRRSSSSAPRPKMNGSPPFRRTTRRCCRARRTSSSLISSCGRLWWPQRLPT